jgi:hypothetical protein
LRLLAVLDDLVFAVIGGGKVSGAGSMGVAGVNPPFVVEIS